ncbi:MAG: hypothetical protein U9N86_08120, partial [Bacteroidota bacterium]|nr:hypothetical protein [Bacteroidota bacterium]
MIKGAARNRGTLNRGTAEQGDGVEITRFFFHLFMGGVVYATTSKNRCPGALHHIICRGIERRNIFRDNTDRNRFIERLGSVLQKSATPCYAWALIPSHFHLLLKTGKEPIAGIMRRLLTGYAVTFNQRHRRCG